MKKLSSLALVALLPGVALALDFDNQTARYSDAPFTRAETAGISVLTDIAAVQGNPDGTFAPARTLNRAEFTKIALLAGRIQTNAAATSGDTCFPDVPAGQWFEPYVCTAEERGIVEGNPDGLFHPERPVNYAEATKILVEIFDYELPTIKTGQDVAWYTPYMLAAGDKGVAIPGTMEPGHMLTRGEMARLAAAFVAESEGQLDVYRAFERGQTISSSSSSSSSTTLPSSSSSSLSSSSASSLSSSSSSVASSSSLFPALSRFLVAGTTTPVLFDGVFISPEENGMLQLIELELDREVHAIEAFILVDGTGRQIAEIPLRNYNNPNNLLWRAEVASGTYTLPKDQGVRLGFKARLKDIGEGAASNELLDLDSLSLHVLGTTSGGSRQIVPTDTHYPLHQTSFGRITSIENGLASTMTVEQGQGKQIGTFTVNGKAASGSSVNVESLTFILETDNVNASFFRIGGSSPLQQEQCATEQTAARVLLTCFVPESMQNVAVTPVTLSVYADLAVASGVSEGTIHLSALGAAGIGSSGSVRWSDQSASFNWIEGDIDLESGPVVTVTK